MLCDRNQNAENPKELEEIEAEDAQHSDNIANPVLINENHQMPVEVPTDPQQSCSKVLNRDSLSPSLFNAGAG